MALNTATEEAFGNISRQMSKIRDQFRKGSFSFWPSDTWTPSVNLYETDAAYLVCVDLAGVEKEKIDVVLEGQQLTLRGTRPVPAQPHDGQPPQSDGNGGEGDGGGSGDRREPQAQQPQPPRIRVHLMEIDHGAFSRVVELPCDVQRERITATYRNGMLWVELPKKS